MEQVRTGSAAGGGADRRYVGAVLGTGGAVAAAGACSGLEGGAVAAAMAACGRMPAPPPAGRRVRIRRGIRLRRFASRLLGPDEPGYCGVARGQFCPGRVPGQGRSSGARDYREVAQDYRDRGAQVPCGLGRAARARRLLPGDAVPGLVHLPLRVLGRVRVRHAAGKPGELASGRMSGAGRRLRPHLLVRLFRPSASLLLPRLSPASLLTMRRRHGMDAGLPPDSDVLPVITPSDAAAPLSAYPSSASFTRLVRPHRPGSQTAARDPAFSARISFSACMASVAGFLHRPINRDPPHHALPPRVKTRPVCQDQPTV